MKEFVLYMAIAALAAVTIIQGHQIKELLERGENCQLSCQNLSDIYKLRNSVYSLKEDAAKNLDWWEAHLENQH